MAVQTQQPLEATLRTPDPREALCKDAAREKLAKLALYEPGKRAARLLAGGQQGLQRLLNHLVQNGLVRLSGHIGRW